MKVDAPKFVFSKFAAIQAAALLFPFVAHFVQTFSWLLRENDIWEEIQKQPSIGVLIKRCSENMQQIYRRRNVPKCDFNKVTLYLTIRLVLVGGPGTVLSCFLIIDFTFGTQP